MIENGEFDQADVFICPPDEDGGDSGEDSGDKEEGGHYKYLYNIWTVIQWF